MHKHRESFLVWDSVSTSNKQQINTEIIEIENDDMMFKVKTVVI